MVWYTWIISVTAGAIGIIAVLVLLCKKLRRPKQEVHRVSTIQQAHVSAPQYNLNLLNNPGWQITSVDPNNQTVVVNTRGPDGVIQVLPRQPVPYYGFLHEKPPPYNPSN